MKSLDEQPGPIGIAVDPVATRGDQALRVAQFAEAYNGDLVTVREVQVGDSQGAHAMVGGWSGSVWCLGACAV